MATQPNTHPITVEQFDRVGITYSEYHRMPVTDEESETLRGGAQLTMTTTTTATPEKEITMPTTKKSVKKSTAAKTTKTAKTTKRSAAAKTVTPRKRSAAKTAKPATATARRKSAKSAEGSETLKVTKVVGSHAFVPSEAAPLRCLFCQEAPAGKAHRRHMDTARRAWRNGTEAAKKESLSPIEGSTQAQAKLTWTELPAETKRELAVRVNLNGAKEESK